MTHLLAAVDAVAPQDGRASRGDPDSGQRVAEHLILLDQALTFLVLQTQYKQGSLTADIYSHRCNHAQHNAMRCAYTTPHATHHIDTAMLAVMYLVVTHYRVAIGADLYSRKCIAIDVIVLDQSAPVAKYIDSALMAVEDVIFSESKMENDEKCRRP